MSTITRLISLDLFSARHLREKSACFKEAAEAEIRPEVAACFYKRVAFLESEAEFLEGRAKRWLDEYEGLLKPGFRDLVTVFAEGQNEL